MLGLHMKRGKILFVTIITILTTLSLFYQSNQITKSEDQEVDTELNKNSVQETTNNLFVKSEDTGIETNKARKGIFTEGNISYIIRNNQFEIFNVKTPHNPILLYSKENKNDFFYDRIFVNNSIVYLKNTDLDSYFSIIEIYDCTDTSDVKLLAATIISAYGTIFVVIENYFYYITQYEILIFEVNYSYDLVFVRSFYFNNDELPYYYYYREYNLDYCYANTTLYLLTQNDVYIIDVQNPINPFVINIFEHKQDFHYSPYYYYSYYYSSSFYYENPLISINHNTLYIFHIYNFTTFDITNMYNIYQTANINLQSLGYSLGNRYSDLWITNTNAFLLFEKALLVLELENYLPTVMSKFISILYGNAATYSYRNPTYCISLFLQNDALFVTKRINSIEREILIIYDISNTSAISLIWLMTFSDVLKFSNLAIYLGLYITILFIVLTSVFFVYSDEIIAKQKEKDREELEAKQTEISVAQEEVGTPNILEKIPISNKVLTGNNLIVTAFAILCIQNLIFPFIAWSNFMYLGFFSSEGSSDISRYLLNIPLFLDIIAILFLIIGLGLKTKEEKSKNNPIVIGIWSIWIVITLVYRVLWGLPKYESLQYSFLPKFYTYQDYLFKLPFLVSTLFFSFAIIITVSFTDVGNYSKYGSIIYAIFNALLGVIFYFTYFSYVYSRLNFTYGLSSEIIIFGAFAGFFKITILPIYGTILFFKLSSDYRSLVTSQKLERYVKRFSDN